MASRELEAVQRAVDRYLAGESALAAARAEGITAATLHRGLNRRGIEKRGPIKGPAHHAWKDGSSTVVQRALAASQRAKGGSSALAAE